MEPQTGPDRRAGLHDRKHRDEGIGQDGGKGSAVHAGLPRRRYTILPRQKWCCPGEQDGAGKTGSPD